MIAATPSYVAVVGPGEGATADECATAESAGRALAEAGVIVVTGGLDGVMEAAARGAVSAGGVTVGLLPHTDRRQANPYLSVSIPTGLGELRNALVVRSADAVLAVGGSWGTMSEIALARRRGMPVVVLGGWTVLAATGPVPLETASTPDVAVDRLLELLAGEAGT
jgi:uncharacterized protein (TIGR00725 family)